MSSSNCCFLTCIQISQEAGQVVWYSHLFQNVPQFVVIHTVKGFGIVNKAEIDVFSGTLAFSMIFLPSVQFSSVQSLSHVRLFATPWTAARQASLSITNSYSSPRLTSSSQWCHPAISSSVVPFSSCPQSLPASESFPMSQLFTWGGQSTGVSALASVPPK